MKTNFEANFGPETMDYDRFYHVCSRKCSRFVHTYKGLHLVDGFSASKDIGKRDALIKDHTEYAESYAKFVFIEKEYYQAVGHTNV